MNGAKTSLVILTGCMVLATVAYLIFLAGTWQQFQQDRVSRDTKIDELLDRLPPKKKEPVVVVDPQ